jgi:hypothetical protein
MLTFRVASKDMFIGTSACDLRTCTLTE